MILIADSGSTKTDWVLAKDGVITLKITTMGLNPFYLDKRSIENEISKELMPFIDPRQVDEIYFYGAGCSSVMRNMMLEDALADNIPDKPVEINTDMLGAARAVLGNEKGIACILGTGSNSCLYDGRDIVENVPSLGFILGDEGSGSYTGKLFLRDFLMGNLPQDLNRDFVQRYEHNRETILDALHKQPMPNRFLASFSEFFMEHISDEYIIRLLSKSFRDFFDIYISRYTAYQEYKAGFTGSFAFYFGDILKSIAAEYGIEIGYIMQSPVEGLAKFHR